MVLDWQVQGMVYKLWIWTGIINLKNQFQTVVEHQEFRTDIFIDGLQIVMVGPFDICLHVHEIIFQFLVIFLAKVTNCFSYLL